MKMKLLLSLLLVLSVLVVGVSQAEAYEIYPGEIRFSSQQADSTIGTIYKYDGFITIYELEQEVFLEPSGNIDIKLLNGDGIVLDSFTTPISPNPTIDPDGGDNTWNISFEIDTSKYNLLTDVEYIVQASYLHMIGEQRLFVYPTLEQSIIDAGIAQKERKNDLTIAEPIPEWIRNIFIFYANNEISDSDLIGALQYLIDLKILKV